MTVKKTLPLFVIKCEICPTSQFLQQISGCKQTILNESIIYKNIEMFSLWKLGVWIKFLGLQDNSYENGNNLKANTRLNIMGQNQGGMICKMTTLNTLRSK